MKIKNLSVSIWTKQILSDINIDLQLGKNYCILGKNGSGKSSLAMSIAWHPQYQITNGQILMESKYIPDIKNIDKTEEYISINELWPDVRAKMWIFVAMQSIPEIAWVKLFEFLRQIYNTRFEKKESFVSFKKIIQPLMVDLRIDKEFLRRDLNVWFSGGEKRKIEILQLKLLRPKYIILDEVDSGLDVDAFRAVAELLKTYDSGENTFIIVTHYFQILEYIYIDEVILMENGKIKQTWDLSLVEKIKKDWFWEIKTS